MHAIRRWLSVLRTLTPSRPHALTPLLCLLLPTLATTAQAQYTSPGSGMNITPNRKEQLDRAIEDARWNLGPVRVQPWFGISNISYRDNIPTAPVDASGQQATTDDVTATGGAGLKLYLPFARDAGVLAAYAQPQYTWWNELDERNQLLGNYGAGLFTFFGRLELEATATRTEHLEITTTEVLDQLPATIDTLQAKSQVEVTSAIALAGSVSYSETSYDAEEGFDPALGLAARALDRNTTTSRLSLRYLLKSNRGYLGAGVQVEETEFDGAFGNRGNDGESVFFEMLLRGNKMDLDLDLVERDLQPTAGSTFEGYEATTGRAAVVLRPGWRFDFRLYGSRSLQYSLVDADQFFQEDRQGIGTGIELSSRMQMTAFYEVGENDYQGTLDGQLARADEDLTAYGADLHIELGRNLGLRIGARQTEIDSQNPLLDRELTEVTVGLSFGGIGWGGEGAGL